MTRLLPWFPLLQAFPFIFHALPELLVGSRGKEHSRIEPLAAEPTPWQLSAKSIVRLRIVMGLNHRSTMLAPFSVVW